MSSPADEIEAVKAGAAAFARNGWALARFFQTYEDARARGLPPEHAINFSFGAMAVDRPPEVAYLGQARRTK